MRQLTSTAAASDRSQVGVLAITFGLILSACGGQTPSPRPPVVIEDSSTVPSSSASPSPAPEIGGAHELPTSGLPEAGRFDPLQFHGLIAYQSRSEILAVDPAAPDRPRFIAMSNGADPIGWAPDGSKLLLAPHPDVVPEFFDGMWWVPDVPSDLSVLSADGTLKSVTQDGKGTWGSFSPDGRMIAYACCGSAPGPYIVAANGGEARSLLGDRCAPPGCGEPLAEWAAWSPVSSEIAYADFWEDHPDHGHHAYVLSFVNADGSGLRGETPGDASGLVWSPDGSRLAFFRGDVGASGEGAQIYVVNADGSELRQLTDEGDNRWPTWSPDGSRIAFVRGEVSFVTGGDGSQEPYVEPGSRWLFIMASDGMDLAPVEGVHPEGPIAWNPNP